MTARKVVLSGLLGALLVVLKEVLAPVPGIEPVTPLIILYALELPGPAPWAIAVFVTLQFLLYGFGLWSWGYLYIWLLLYLAARAFRRMQGALAWAVFSAVFGLCFGALFTPVYFLTQGPGGALAWWLAGIPTDVAHAAGNFAVMLVFYTPLRRALHRVSRRSGGGA